MSVTTPPIERIYDTFGQCRSPGTFLAWTFQQLRDAVRALRRQEPPIASLDGDGDGSAGTLGARLAADNVDPGASLAADERHKQLDGMVHAFLQRHPRAKEQLAALLLKHVEGLDDQTISQRLGKPVQSLYVLRARAKQKLQREPEWRVLAADLGIALDEQ